MFRNRGCVGRRNPAGRRDAICQTSHGGVALFRSKNRRDGVFLGAQAIQAAGVDDDQATKRVWQQQPAIISARGGRAEPERSKKLVSFFPSAAMRLKIRRAVGLEPKGLDVAVTLVIDQDDYEIRLVSALRLRLTQQRAQEDERKK